MNVAHIRTTLRRRAYVEYAKSTSSPISYRLFVAIRGWQ